LISRRFATLLAAAGLATAVIGFVVLAGTTRTTEAQVSGDIAAAWGGPYQLLVRPPGSATTIERDEGLVRPNAISGLYGGITEPQLIAIRAIPGVDVAAPIAVAGFVQWPAGVPLDLASLAPASGLTVLRIQTSIAAEAGLSHFPAEMAGYLVIAPQGRVVVTAGRPRLEVDGQEIGCDPPVTCFGGATPGALPVRGLPAGTPGVFANFPEPFVIAGIDPAAEAQLLGLNRCVSAGRYLEAADVPSEVSSPAGMQPAIPVLASDRSFLDETLMFTVERAANPETLALNGVDNLSGWQSVATRTATADDAYRAFLPTLQSGSFYDASPLWAIGAVTYDRLGPDHLLAETVPADPSVYRTQVVMGAGVPPEAEDVWFHSVTRHDQKERSELFSRWTPIGQFDPDCVPGFDVLGGGRLETYSLPAVQIADGRQLGATRSPASYVTSPPLILVSLDTAAWFADPSRYVGGNGAAFISAIRVRVAGAETSSQEARDRIARVAADIHDATGLNVDIVAGSSPRKVAVDLPAGNFGRPALTVSELWSVKGVAVRFARALAAQDLAIFTVVLVAATVLIAATAFLASRRRHAEFAVLRALGWPAWRIGALVELEIIMLGAVVAVFGLAVAAGLRIALGLDIAPWQLAAVVPLSLMVSVIAGLGPAMASARVSALRALTRGPERVGRAASVRELALRDLLGSRRTEAALGALTIGLGATLVGAAALVMAGFAGQLDTTLLGIHIAARARIFHLIVALLTLTIGALAVAEIVTLGYVERQAEFAALRALGWPRRAVATVVAVQAFAIGGLGGMGAALLVGVLGLVLSATPMTLATSFGLAFLSAVLATMLAAAVPLQLVYRVHPAAALRGE
jgi:ABC-type lipoprotein release transport system permease subunit